jgi:hypothetical protein
MAKSPAKKPAAKAAPKAAPKKAAPKAKAAAPAAPAKPKTPAATIAKAEHDHQDPRVGADHGHAASGFGKHQHEGIPPAPRFNKVINWFRRGSGR